MGKKLYSAVLKKGEHLVQSKENPGRVRGLSRDANNKNPGIPEFEEIDIDDLKKEIEQDVYAKLQPMQPEPRQASALDLFVEMGNTFNNVTRIALEHPEALEAAKKVGGKLKKLLSKKQSDHDTEGENDNNSQYSEETAHPIWRKKKEPQSVEKERQQILKMIEGYFSYKKEILTTKVPVAAVMESTKFKFNELTGSLSEKATEHPALISDTTYKYVYQLLQHNDDLSENRQILEALKFYDTTE